MNPFFSRAFFFFAGHWADAVFVILLLIGFWLRVSLLSYPILERNSSIDANRDYLVARHITAYHEFPLAGPWNGVFGDLKNSPIYYYFLALFLFVRDDIMFLSLVNIVLQLVGISAFYVFVRIIFGATAALFAAILFLFSHLAFSQALHAWQPYFMQPFFYMSFLLTLLAYLKRSYRLLLASIFLFVFTGALHNSAFALLPTFIGMCVYFLISQRFAFRYYAGALAVFVGALGFFYVPLLIHLMREWDMLKMTIFKDQLFISSLGEYVTHLAANAHIFLDALFRKSRLEFLRAPLLLMTWFSLIFYLFQNHNDMRRKNCVMVMLLALLQVLLLASLFRAEILDFYFTPLYGIFFALLAAVIMGVLPQRPIFFVIKAIFVGVLVFVFSAGFQFTIARYDSAVSREQVIGLISTFTREISRLRNKEGFASNNFFGVSFYKYPIDFELPNAPIIAPLEKVLGEKLVSVNNVVGSSYVSITNDTYRFLVCAYYPDVPDSDYACKRQFFIRHPLYSLVRSVYTDDVFSVYLLRRTTGGPS